MNVILLSGGSGKRLWPLSNDVRSKQFLKIFPRADGTKESMLQRMYRMIQEADPEAAITIATSETQVPQIRAQLGDSVCISAEPARRDTFPAIALAAACLAARGIGRKEPVVVCPVDPFADAGYYRCLKEMSDEAGRPDAANLTLMGIKPTCPSTKYGYIMPAGKGRITAVSGFREKPDEATAEKYILAGALWNGGVFAFRLDYVLGIARKMFGTDDYRRLYDGYGELRKISFDYAITEGEKSVSVIRYNGGWKDLGTWNTLTEVMDGTVTGPAVTDGCTNTHVVNELGIPLIALGVNDAVIAATPDGILVTSKARSSELKDFVYESLPVSENQSQGECRVLDCRIHHDRTISLTRELTVAPGQKISCQCHKHRTGVWTFTEGVGDLTLEDKVIRVRRGDVTVIKAGMKHAVRAVEGELHIIEVQIGDRVSGEDTDQFGYNNGVSGIMDT